MSEKRMCEIILNLGQQFRKKRCLNIFFLFLALEAILFGGSDTTWAILVKALLRKIWVKLF